MKTKEVMNMNNKNNKFHGLDLAKPYESIDDYNFLLWYTAIDYSQDITKFMIPNYKEMDEEIVSLVYRAVLKAVQELTNSDRILITQRELNEFRILRERQEEKTKEVEVLAIEYGSLEIARVIVANVLAEYGNAGNKRSDGYRIAKKWCVENGLFEAIEYRGINGLPANE